MKKFAFYCAAAGLMLLPGAADATEFEAGIGAPASNPKAYRAEFRDGVYRVSNRIPSRYCALELPVAFAFRPDLLLTFEYRNLLPEKEALDYNAVALVDENRQTTFGKLPESRQWRRARIALGQQRYGKDRTPPATGIGIIGVNIYSRSRAAEGIQATLEVRDLRIAPDPDYDPAAGLRISYSALPLFDWPATPGGRYRLEHSADPAFPEAGTVRIQVQEPFFVPSEPLPPGVRYYRVTDAGTGKVLASDALYIPTPAQDWRLPAWDFRAFAAAPRPRLKRLAAYYHPHPESLIRHAEALCRYPIPPDPKPYQEGADPRYPAWIDWYNLVGNGIITPTGRRLAAVGQAALLSDRQDFREKAREWLLEVARNWDPEGGSHARRHDLAVSNLLLGMAWCLDAAWDIMTGEERAVAAAAIRARGDQYWEWLHPFRGEEANNHPWDQAQAAAVAVLSLPEAPEAEMRFRYLCSLFACRFLPALGFDGENNEGLGYWSYGTGLLVRFVELARYTVGVDLFQHPWLRRTARFPLYSAPDGGFGISFADTGSPNHGLTGPVNRQLVATLGAAAADPAALWYAGVPERHGRKAEIPLGIPQSQYYPHIGVTLFNTFLPDGRENVAVGFHSGRYYAGHQHPDQNSFVINAYGEKLAIDGGYCDWYNSPHFKAYSARTVAHNTILVDGKGQAFHRFGADGRTTAFLDSPDFGYVAGDAADPDIYGGALKRFDRQLLFLKPGVVIVADRLEAERPSVFSWLFHAQGEPPIAVAGNTFSVARPRARLDGVMLLPEPVVLTTAPAYRTPPNRVASMEPEPNPEPEWLLTATPSAAGRETEFLAALSIRRREEFGTDLGRWQLAGTPDARILRNREFLVLLQRHPGRRVELGGLTTDAAVAAVRLAPDGRAAAAMFINGTRLTFGAQEWTLPEKGNFATPSPEAVPATAAGLTYDGRKIPARLHVTPEPAKRFVLDARLHLTESRRLAFHMAPGKFPRCIRISGDSCRAVAEIPAGEGACSGVALPPGDYLLSVVSEAPLEPLAITDVSAECLRAEPSSSPPDGTGIRLEAENYHSVSHAVAELSRPDASGGKLLRGWNTEGVTLVWRIPVSAAGRYRLWLRLAAESGAILVRVSGDLFPEPVLVAMDATGGAGFAPDEYRWFRIPELSKPVSGEVRLRLEVLQGAPSWDCLELEPVSP